ncbi:MAG: hypothetical protein HQK89_00880 [Nitrospirae bacterium]|nr:hypothetical protein [Nitrospirota bacterium]
MVLPKHERTSTGAFRKENGNSRAGNLSKEYPEFSKVPPNTKLETLREESGETLINGVRKYIREHYT